MHIRHAAVFILLAASCMAKTPTLVRIDGKLWQIKEVKEFSEDHDLMGNTDCAPRRIRILSRLTTLQKVDTFIHEIQHAFTCENGDVQNEKYNNNDSAQDQLHNHDGIYWATPHWFRFLCENPEIVRWIQANPDPNWKPEIEPLPDWVLR